MNYKQFPTYAINTLEITTQGAPKTNKTKQDQNTSNSNYIQNGTRNTPNAELNAELIAKRMHS